MKSTLLLAPLALGSAAAQAADRQIIAPGAQWETNEAPSNGVIFLPTQTARMQLGFDRTLFGASAVMVKSFAFRYDSITNQTQVPVIPYDFGRTVIQAALLGVLDTMSGVFAGNLQTGRKTLLDRDYAFDATNPGPANGPRGFTLTFNFDTPFRYDPNVGDLVIDLMTSKPTVTFMTVDYVRTGVTTMRIAAGPGSASVGNGNASFALGPITRITVADVSAVPEPATWALMVGGFGVAGAASRRRLGRKAVLA